MPNKTTKALVDRNAKICEQFQRGKSIHRLMQEHELGLRRIKLILLRGGVRQRKERSDKGKKRAKANG